jgi:hypothetical protein
VPSEYASVATAHAVIAPLNHQLSRDALDRHMLRITFPVLFGRWLADRPCRDQNLGRF